MAEDSSETRELLRAIYERGGNERELVAAGYSVARLTALVERDLLDRYGPFSLEETSDATGARRGPETYFIYKLTETGQAELANDEGSH